MEDWRLRDEELQTGGLLKQESILEPGIEVGGARSGSWPPMFQTSDCVNLKFRVFVNLKVRFVKSEVQISHV